MLYGALEIGERPQHKLKLRFNECVKDSLTKCPNGENNCEELPTNWGEWRTSIDNGTNFLLIIPKQSEIKIEFRKGTYLFQFFNVLSYETIQPR